MASNNEIRCARNSSFHTKFGVEFSTKTSAPALLHSNQFSLQSDFDSADSDAKDVLGGTDMAEGVQRRIVSRKVSMEGILENIIWHFLHHFFEFVVSD